LRTSGNNDDESWLKFESSLVPHMGFNRKPMKSVDFVEQLLKIRVAWRVDCWFVFQMAWGQRKYQYIIWNQFQM
jgi:hypothetical protein